MNNNKSDTLYASRTSPLEAFTFDQTVVDVFPDMINRSVPGYSTIIRMIGQLATRYAKADSTCYDLGCSLGASTLAMRQGIHTQNTHIIAVDNSSAMIERCQNVVANDKSPITVKLLCDNIQDTLLENASLIVMNFTLQFIPVEQREKMLQKIYDALLPGGVLILSEKIAFTHTAHHELMIDLHHDFKRANGYSDLEIAQKRSALENVLIPETMDTHQQRLKNAGFSDTDVWFQCFNFISLLAFK